MYLFGYGSLVNLKSAQKSFARELKHEDFIAVKLSGYEKIWNAIEFILFDGDTEESNGVFLNLNKKKNAQTNGVLIRVSEKELENLKLREKSYSYIQIPNESLIGFETKETIFTFMTTNQKKIAKLHQANCFIPQKYIELLENGLIPYDEAFKKEFIDSYSNLSFPIKDGSYIFVDPIQNKFAKGIS